LSLIGGVGTLGAFFLPWLSLTLISEEYCSSTDCYSTPDSASIPGWELFAHPFLAFLLLPLFVLTVAVNIGSGVIHLRARRWKPAWSWRALLLTSVALAAFVPWLSTYHLPGRPNLVDGHVVSQQYALGLYAAMAAVLVSLAGTLLQQDWRPRQPSSVTAHEQGRSATHDRRFSSGLAAVSLALILVFIVFIIATSDVFLLRVDDAALQKWEVFFFVVVPPLVGGLALTSLFHALRRRHRVWFVVLCFPLTQSALGWAYVLSGYLGTPGQPDATHEAGMTLAPLWDAYLLSVILLCVYAVFLWTRRTPTPSAA
jgi:Ca2+/H+ antiporter